MAWRGTRPTAFADTIAEDVGKRARAAALQALTGVIERSPVDTGAFRGNNRVSVGRADTTADPQTTDRQGGATIAAGASVIASTRGAPFTVIYIQNNLPYAQRLEDGWSQQTGGRPGGIYAITLNNLAEASR